MLILEYYNKRICMKGLLNSKKGRWNKSMESNLKRKLLGDSNIRGVEILNIKKGT